MSLRLAVLGLGRGAVPWAPPEAHAALPPDQDGPPADGAKGTVAARAGRHRQAQGLAVPTPARAGR